MTKRRCETCKLFTSVTGMPHIGVCAKTFYTPTCEFESLRIDDDACDFFEERTDSPEKLVNDMLEAIWCVGPYTGACDGITRECRYADDKGECRAAEEFTDRARALGIEVE